MRKDDLNRLKSGIARKHREGETDEAIAKYYTRACNNLLSIKMMTRTEYEECMNVLNKKEDHQSKQMDLFSEVTA